MLVLHYTGMVDHDRALDLLCDPRSQVSAHYFVGEDGRVLQLVDERDRAWHAGKACWCGEEDVNSLSIGIEIANVGHEYGYPDFPDRQVVAVIELCRDIIGRWRIRPERVLGHSDVAPGRKRDPGEKFPWPRLAAAGIGHHVAPAPITAGEALGRGDEGRAVARLQEDLAGYGYRIPKDGCFDAETEAVVAAFQRHFRPQAVDGRADRSTLETLARLLDALGGARGRCGGGGVAGKSGRARDRFADHESAKGAGS